MRLSHLSFYRHSHSDAPASYADAVTYGATSDSHEHSHAEEGHGHSHGDSGAHDEESVGGGHSHGSMNMQGVFLHVLGDALGNVGVIASGLVIALWSSPLRFYSDPLISFIITIIIFSSALPLGPFPLPLLFLEKALSDLTCLSPRALCLLQSSRPRSSSSRPFRATSRSTSSGRPSSSCPVSSLSTRFVSYLSSLRPERAC
jgi:hypothetical protein